MRSTQVRLAGAALHGLRLVGMPEGRGGGLIVDDAEA
jgi:hypothetical protein